MRDSSLCRRAGAVALFFILIPESAKALEEPLLRVARDSIETRIPYAPQVLKRQIWETLPSPAVTTQMDGVSALLAGEDIIPAEQVEVLVRALGVHLVPPLDVMQDLLGRFIEPMSDTDLVLFKAAMVGKDVRLFNAAQTEFVRRGLVHFNMAKMRRATLDEVTTFLNELEYAPSFTISKVDFDVLAAALNLLATSNEGGFRFSRMNSLTITESRGHSPEAWQAFFEVVGEFMPHLEALSLRQCTLGETVVAALAGSPLMAKLTALDLSENSYIQDVGARTLAHSPNAANLKSLNLRDNQVGYDGVAALAGSPYLAKLTYLDIGVNNFSETMGAAGATVIANSAYMANLRTLNLGNHLIGPDGVRAIAISPYLNKLESLELCGNNMTDDGVEALAASPNMANVRTLGLGWNAIGEDGVEALAASPNMANILSLDLAGNDLLSDAAVAIAESPHLTKVTTLNLRFNRVGLAGVQALAGSINMKSLASLNLATNLWLGNDAAHAIAHSSHMANLRFLDLEYGGITDDGARALAESAVLSHLTSLNLSQNGIGDEAAEAIAASRHMGRLTSLKLANTGIGQAGWKALRASPYVSQAIQTIWHGLL